MIKTLVGLKDWLQKHGLETNCDVVLVFSDIVTASQATEKFLNELGSSSPLWIWPDKRLQVLGFPVRFKYREVVREGEL